MKRLMLVGVIVAMAMGVGCNKGGGALTEEQVKAMSDEELAESAVKMAQAIGNAATKNKGNCDAMGADLTKVIADYKPLQARSKEFDKDPAKKKWFEEKYQKRAMEPMQAALPALMECANNESVKKAFETLG